MGYDQIAKDALKIHDHLLGIKEDKAKTLRLLRCGIVIGIAILIGCDGASVCADARYGAAIDRADTGAQAAEHHRVAGCAASRRNRASATYANGDWTETGTKSMSGNGGARVKIYAPTTWSSGSSYSHLDYTTFARWFADSA